MTYEIYIKQDGGWSIVDCGLSKEQAIKLVTKLEAQGHEIRVEVV